MSLDSLTLIRCVLCLMEWLFPHNFINEGLQLFLKQNSKFKSWKNPTSLAEASMLSASCMNMQRYHLKFERAIIYGETFNVLTALFLFVRDSYKINCKFEGPYSPEPISHAQKCLICILIK